MTGFAGERGVSEAARARPGPPGRLAAGWAWPVGVAAVVAVAVAVLAGGNAAGRPALAVTVALVQACLVAGWLVSFAATVDAAVLVVVAVAVADVVLLRSRAATGGSIAGVIGLSVIAVLFRQLARRDPRGVTAAVALTLSAIVLGAAPGLLLALRELPAGRSGAFVALVASGAALVTVRLPVGPDPVRRVGALALGVVVSLVCGLGQGGLSTGHAVAMGTCCAVTVLLVDRLLVRIAAAARVSGPSRAALSHAVVAALVPLALACPVAYLVGRVIAPVVG